MNNLPNFPTFPAFDVDTDKANIGTRWEKWLARLENLFIAMDVKDAPQKRAMLLHYAGEKVYDIYDIQKRDTDATFEATKKVLNDYFSPQKNIPKEKHNFRKHKQNKSQTLDEYVTELRTLAKNCEFADIDSEILQQVILNSRSKRFQERALSEPTKGLEYILAIGRMMEEPGKPAPAVEGQDKTVKQGMASVVKQKMCTVVPANFFGAIPGVEVGTIWKTRVQVSEAGVHRHVDARIAGTETDGAYSIILSGGYEDDTDNGNTFLFTGISTGNKGAAQSCDQTLTRKNRALAKNCNAPIDAKNGATSIDWRAGRQIRVVRNCKLAKHSEYAPYEGNRYDGIYKIVKYWSEKGKSGFLVWRYKLQRDDHAPAPWTEEGKRRIRTLGLTMQYPDGYLEAQAKKVRAKEEAANTPGKRKRKDSDEDILKL